MQYKRVASLKTAEDFRNYLQEQGVDLPFDEEVQTAPESPLAQPIQVGRFNVGNRFCIHPMEGWDGTEDGRPTEHVIRRWKQFGDSGAKLIWGGEAIAVRLDARANPNQLSLNEDNKAEFAALRETLVNAHQKRFGRTDDLLIGLQLTHSGRFCKPTDKARFEWKIVYHHPILDGKFGIPDNHPILTDDEIREIVGNYHQAARLAAEVGFNFVDIKHCHGYLLHEFLSAYTRPGDYGGSFENRTRILREIVEGIRADNPDLLIGVRLSAFDFVPFRPDPDRTQGKKLGPGIPEPFDENLPYQYAFSTDQQNPVEYNLEETFRFMELLKELDITLVNLSAGSPYYNPHIQRPAIFPPSDGYQPPEDPLAGVARQIHAHAKIKEQFPEMVFVGTGYTYLQEYLPNVAQYTVRNNMIDFVGLGRMVLCYHDLPADLLETGELTHKRICRTFSDCTTAPRNGLISGCFPLDDYYKESPVAVQLKDIKRKA
tara:strand:- start:164 stop:1621 length:1458 start_codon:yes stop_codon:yes gene_type:complete